MPKPILLLDDAQGSMSELAAALRSAGYNPQVVAVGADVLVAFKAAQAELVFASLNGY